MINTTIGHSQNKKDAVREITDLLARLTLIDDTINELINLGVTDEHEYSVLFHRRNLLETKYFDELEEDRRHVYKY